MPDRALLSLSLLRRGASVGLRASTLLARFALLYSLAVYLSPAEVGLYGLLYATISYGLLVVGFDFNVFSVREFISSTGEAKLQVARNYGVFILCAQVIALPASLLIFFSELLPWGLAGWFLVLLSAEHISQELGRILIAESRPLTAAMVQFVRWAAWVFVVLALMWFDQGARNLDVVLAGWAVGSVLSCVIGLMSLRLGMRALVGRINWRWIGAGMKAAAFFFASTLCWRAVNVLDRYWIEDTGGGEVLAAYVLFAGFANVITGFLDAAVFSFSYPQVVEAAARKDVAAFSSGMRHMTLHTVWLTLVLAGAVLVLAKPVLAQIGKDVYVEHYPVLIWAVIAVSVLSFSMIPHFALYAWRQDAAIIASHVLSLPFFIATTFLLQAWLESYAVPVAVAFTFLAILLFKHLNYARFRRMRFDLAR